MMIEIRTGFSVRAENVSHIKIMQCSNRIWCWENGKPRTDTKHWREVQLFVLGKLEKTWMFNGSRKSDSSGDPANKKEEAKAEKEANTKYKELLDLLETTNSILNF